jgi:hypothetical protein
MVLVQVIDLEHMVNQQLALAYLIRRPNLHIQVEVDYRLANVSLTGLLVSDVLNTKN